MIAREVLDAAARVIRPGITTDEIDRVVHEATIAAGGYPSPLNYHFFPKSCCTYVNEVICHGIPDAMKLEDGDIVNVDVTVYYKGVHGDLNETYFVGNVGEARVSAKPFFVSVSVSGGSNEPNSTHPPIVRHFIEYAII